MDSGVQKLFSLVLAKLLQFVSDPFWVRKFVKKGVPIGQGGAIRNTNEPQYLSSSPELAIAFNSTY